MGINTSMVINTIIELCSNSKCALATMCIRSVDHHIDLDSKIGLQDRGIKIRHYHPTGKGFQQSCLYFMKKV